MPPVESPTGLYLDRRGRAAQIARRALGTLREVGLTVAATAGLLCVVAVIASHAFGLGLVVFRTGSMSPSLPAGAVAVVREVAAADVHVGDVVTVTTPRGQRPVTHRVVGVEPATDGSAVLILKGDANPAADPFPYPVTTVRRVVARVPVGGAVLGALRSPLTLGTATLLVAAAVTWAYWPRERPLSSRG